MNPVLIIALLGGGAYVLFRGGLVKSPNAAPGPGEPGWVTLGGAPAGDDFNPQPGIAMKADAIAGSVLGAAGAAGAGSASGLIGSSGLLASSTTLGAALPFIGIGIVVTGLILTMISKHHQEALRNEGKVLNTAMPRMLNASVLVAQAAIRKEITTTVQAKKLLDQIVSDYYGEVRPIMHGKWPYTDEDFAKNILPDNTGPGTNNSGARVRREGIIAPDPCNAACYMGHYFVERYAKIVLSTTQAILAGQHGLMVLPQVPKHMTQQGFAEITMVY